MWKLFAWGLLFSNIVGFGMEEISKSFAMLNVMCFGAVLALIRN